MLYNLLSLLLLTYYYKLNLIFPFKDLFFKTPQPLTPT